MLGGIQDQHLLFVLLLKLVIVLLRGRREILGELCRRRGLVAIPRIVQLLVIKLRLQERLLILIAEIRVGHVKGRGLRSIFSSCIHLPCDLSSLEIDQGLLERRHDVLS
jgi:hypothetical protein